MSSHDERVEPWCRIHGTVLGPTPRGDLAGLRAYWKSDVFSGFLVFLIALPLCLGIAVASGYPAIAGVLTAVIGAVVSTLVSNSELTIKGPAAGLIVVTLGAITELREIHGPDAAYRLALGVGVAAGILQVVFALLRSGILGEFFPSSTVSGMLAAIGITIVLKQVPILLGADASGRPTPAIAAIGVLSLAVLFALPRIKHPVVRRVPAPLVVLLIAIPLGFALGLSDAQGERFLVSVPRNILSAITTPSFDAMKTLAGWKWALMYALVGSLESLLSAKAIDLIDPHRRKTNLDRDLLAVGFGNTLCAAVGALPMISEIVRSKANLDAGARTRFANLWHGLFLLAFVALAPGLIHRVPLSALAAMLVYTGLRLASPREFVSVYRIGRDQLIVYVATIVAVLATDLLVGIAVGIAVEMLLHLLHDGVSFATLFRPRFEVVELAPDRVAIAPLEAAVFANWLQLRKRVMDDGLLKKRNVRLDLSRTRFVDHTVMAKLHDMQRAFTEAHLELEIEGLEVLQSFSGHRLGARRRGLAPVKRVTIVTEAEVEKRLLEELITLGATGFTATRCTGAGRSRVEAAEPVRIVECTRIECIVNDDLAERLVDHIRLSVLPSCHATVVVETVEVVNPDHF